MSITREAFMAALGGAEAAFNAYLEAADAQQGLARFEYKVIAVNITDWDMQLYLLPSQDGVRLLTQYEGDVDTWIKGKTMGLAKLMLGDSQKVMFSGEVVLEGDVELGQAFKRWLDSIEVDWEEILSGYTGDVVAHYAGKAVKSLNQWGQQAIQAFEQNAADYLHFEGQDVPLNEEVSEQAKDINTFRDDVERLQARIKLIQNHLHKVNE